MLSAETNSQIRQVMKLEVGGKQRMAFQEKTMKKGMSKLQIKAKKLPNSACYENDLYKYVAVAELETPSKQLTRTDESENVFQMIFNPIFLLSILRPLDHFNVFFQK